MEARDTETRELERGITSPVVDSPSEMMKAIDAKQTS